ncbi:MAG: hypothetical protein AABW41_03670 [Nanoarchaeota archaeon]
MRESEFFYENSLIGKSLINDYLKKLEPEIKKLNESLNLRYTSEYGFINLPDDRALILKIKNLTLQKKENDLEYLVVIGIGGSSLGTIAILEAIKGKFYNLLHNTPKIIFVESLDTFYLTQVIHLLEDSFKSGKKVLLNLISNSGTTTESIANFEILIAVMKKYIDNYHKYVVVTTDKGSLLNKIAIENRFEVLETPNLVSGRFSVLSAVGFFPLALLGIDIEKLVYGAKVMRKRCLSIKENPAAINAIVMYLSNQGKKNIYESLFFSIELEALGKWYRQLVAESVGKEFTKFGNKINAGITPTVAIGSNDMHSMFQLYIAGPKDKLLHIISLDKTPSINIPKHIEYSNLVNNIQNKPAAIIMGAIIKSVKLSFKERSIPFTECLLNSNDEFSVGEFLMMKQIEVIYLAYLFMVNPFDQPNVELYKENLKKLLKR